MNISGTTNFQSMFTCNPIQTTMSTPREQSPITDVLGRYLMASSGDARELYCSALTQGGWRMVAPARITKLIKILDLAKKIRFLNSFVID